jgi:hypothetical protein
VMHFNLGKGKALAESSYLPPVRRQARANSFPACL